jgi:predicted RNA binding protein YcfA (HicA-like mRNA interferase family)
MKQFKKLLRRMGYLNMRERGSYERLRKLRSEKLHKF